MRIYSATVRPAGDLHTEIFKENLTAAEIMVLRHLHGEDAVLKIQPMGERNVRHAEERARLVTEFGGETHGENVIRTVFGPKTVRLPTELEDVVNDPILDDDDEPVVDAKSPEPVMPAPKTAQRAAI